MSSETYQCFNQILFQKTAGNNELETPSVINNKHQNIYVVAPKLPADTSEAISTASSATGTHSVAGTGCSRRDGAGGGEDKMSPPETRNFVNV